MFSMKAALVLGLVALAAGDSFKNKYGSCRSNYGNFWKVPSGNSQPNIIEYLTDITSDTYVSLTVTTTITAEYQTWLSSFTTAIDGYLSLGLSEEEILIKVSSQLLILKYQYPDVYAIVKSAQLGSLGSIEDLVSIAAEFQTNSVLGEIQVNGEAFLAQLVASVPSEYQSSFQAFVTANLESIVSSTTLTVSEKLAQIYEQISTVYFVSYPAAQASIQVSQISGFGSFGSFFNVAKRYYQVQLASTYFSGSSAQFLIDFNATILSSTLPKVQKAQLNTILKNLTITFETVTDVSARIELFSEIYENFISLNPVLAGYWNGLQFGSFGSLYEILTLSVYFGQLPPAYVPPTGATEEATTVEVSTVEASTVEASTVEASTVEASTVEASTVEASTVEASTVEASTVESSTTQEYETTIGEYSCLCSTTVA